MLSRRPVAVVAQNATLVATSCLVAQARTFITRRSGGSSKDWATFSPGAAGFQNGESGGPTPVSTHSSSSSTRPSDVTDAKIRTLMRERDAALDRVAVVEGQLATGMSSMRRELHRAMDKLRELGCMYEKNDPTLVSGRAWWEEQAQRKPEPATATGAETRNKPDAAASPTSAASGSAHSRRTGNHATDASSSAAGTTTTTTTHSTEHWRASPAFARWGPGSDGTATRRCPFWNATWVPRRFGDCSSSQPRHEPFYYDRDRDPAVIRRRVTRRWQRARSMLAFATALCVSYDWAVSASERRCVAGYRWTCDGVNRTPVEPTTTTRPGEAYH